ncbi:hypothetical protein FQN54_008489 [Arachnomyces sp. PD_36]|nr:hypothetical protein FQN54_008489 [Arachnomyces sp. PD_36]
MENSLSTRFSPTPDLAESVSRRLRAATSKPAQKAYLNALLFSAACFALLGVSSIAYCVFYYRFVPQVGLERVVHLQFGDGHPFGSAPLGSELASLQAYDVSVSLQLPRTPSNLAAGNFMLDLSLISPPANSFQDNTSTYVLAQSRRPAILTFSSPMVDTVSRIWRMPLYVLGWKKEAETLVTGMMEGVEFAKGWRNIPGSLRLELQSQERMQVYSATVKFTAKFKGLRWIMYNFRILSFLVFTFFFWVVSIVSTVMIWLTLSSIEPEDETDEETSSAEGESSDDKPLMKSKKKRRRRVRKSILDRVKKDDDEIKKEEEDIEESTQIEPLVSDTGGTEEKTEH